MYKRIAIMLLVLLFGIYGGISIITAKNAKKVAYNVQERDARMQKTLWSLFQDQK